MVGEAGLLRSDGTARPADTSLARRGPTSPAVVQHFYADASLMVLLPNGGIHDGLLSGVGDAAEAMAVCERQIGALATERYAP